jgi:biopolymer transport protein ExbB
VSKLGNAWRVVAATAAALIAVESYAAVSWTQLQEAARQMRARETQIAQQREARFRAELQKQEQLANQWASRRNAAEARSGSLDKQWNANDTRIQELKMLLKQHEGNLGELFGVTRQLAGDAANVLQQSMLTAQFEVPKGQEDRVTFLKRLAAAKALPSIKELERMWFELHREMTESGKTVVFKAKVEQPDEEKTVTELDVLRVGPFIASADGEFLTFIGSESKLKFLERQPSGSLRGIAEDLQESSGVEYQEAIVDPARGALLAMYVERPNFIERIQHGEVVGYVIVAVGIIGVLLSIYQAFYLFATRMSVATQLRNLAAPSTNNPLGRVILAFRGDGKQAKNAELAELRISEAVLRELPTLQRFQAFLRLAVAAGPLLGLIGTVIGMIITFHAIVESGSSDPKLMAHGIGQAMIATVLGLGIAIPLLFINSGLTALSNGITLTLDEQSQSLLASDLMQRKTAK